MMHQTLLFHAVVWCCVYCLLIETRQMHLEWQVYAVVRCGKMRGRWSSPTGRDWPGRYRWKVQARGGGDRKTGALLFSSNLSRKLRKRARQTFLHRTSCIVELIRYAIWGIKGGARPGIISHHHSGTFNMHLQPHFIILININISSSSSSRMRMFYNTSLCTVNNFHFLCTL